MPKKLVLPPGCASALEFVRAQLPAGRMRSVEGLARDLEAASAEILDMAFGGGSPLACDPATWKPRLTTAAVHWTWPRLLARLEAWEPTLHQRLLDWRDPEANRLRAEVRENAANAKSQADEENSLPDPDDTAEEDDDPPQAAVREAPDPTLLPPEEAEREAARAAIGALFAVLPAQVRRGQVEYRTEQEFLDYLSGALTRWRQPETGRLVSGYFLEELRSRTWGLAKKPARARRSKPTAAIRQFGLDAPDLKERAVALERALAGATEQKAIKTIWRAFVAACGFDVVDVRELEVRRDDALARARDAMDQEILYRAYLAALEILSGRVPAPSRLSAPGEQLALSRWQMLRLEFGLLQEFAAHKAKEAKKETYSSTALEIRRFVAANESTWWLQSLERPEPPEVSEAAADDELCTCLRACRQASLDEVPRDEAGLRKVLDRVASDLRRPPTLEGFPLWFLLHRQDVGKGHTATAVYTALHGFRDEWAQWLETDQRAGAATGQVVQDGWVIRIVGRERRDDDSDHRQAAQ